MKYLLLILILFPLTGCLSTKTGTTTKTYYDVSLQSTVVESSEVAIGDGDTEYHKTVRQISTDKASIVTAQANAIMYSLKPVPKETKSEAAYRGIVGALLVAQVDTSIAGDISQVLKSKTGYDVADTALGVVKTGVVGTAVAYTVDKVTGALVEAVGNKINITGDGNKVETSDIKTTQTNEAHATTVGDNSPANTNLDQSKPVVFEPVDNDETEEVDVEAMPAAGEMPASCEGEGVYDPEKERWYIEGSGGCSCESRADKSC